MQTITVNQAIGDLDLKRTGLRREIDAHCTPIIQQVQEMEGRIKALTMLVGVEKIDLGDADKVHARIGEIRRESSGLRAALESYARPRRERIAKLDQEIRGLMLQDGTQQIVGPLFESRAKP